MADETSINRNVSRHVLWAVRRPDNPLTIGYLAEQLHLSRQRMSARVNGRHGWTADEIDQLAQILDVPPQLLVAPDTYWQGPATGSTGGVTHGYLESAPPDAA